jgi:hypothetical protein
VNFIVFLIVIFVCVVLFSGDLNINVDFSDSIFVKIYSKFDVRKTKIMAI